MFNIALMTYRQLLRNKILGVLVLFSFVFIIVSISIGELSIGDDKKLIVDFGVGMIEMVGLIVALFIGSKIITDEIQNRTIYLIMSKPLKRYSYIFGKFLGFSAVLALITLVQSGVFIAVMMFNEIAVSDIILISLLAMYIKLLVVFGMVMLFSLFTGQMVTIFVSLGIYIVAHAATTIIDVSSSSSLQGTTPMEIFGWIIYIVFPNFEAMNVKDVIHYGSENLHNIELFGKTLGFQYAYVWANSIFAILYIWVLLSFSSLLFKRKTFEA